MLRLRIGREPREAAFDIPSFWGLDGLSRIAAGLALGRGLPSPVPFDQQPESEATDEYRLRMQDEGETLPLSSLAYPPPDGIYRTEEDAAPLRARGERMGTLEGLRSDVQQVAPRLGGATAADVERLQAEIAAGPFGLERYCCAALLAASELALRERSWLELEWYYPPGLAPAVIPAPSTTFWALAS